MVSVLNAHKDMSSITMEFAALLTLIVNNTIQLSVFAKIAMKDI